MGSVQRNRSQSREQCPGDKLYFLIVPEKRHILPMFQYHEKKAGSDWCNVRVNQVFRN
jgi:hypothetical protein